MKRLASLVIALTVMASGATAFANAAGVTFWDADIQGSVKSGSMDVDLKNDLGLGDKNILEYNLDLNFLGPKAYLHYYKASNSGVNTLTRNIDYNGETFTNGTAVTSNLKEEIIDLTFAKSVLKTDALQVDLLGGIKYISMDTNIAGGGNSATDSVRGLVPTIGIGAQSHLSKDLLAKASISGFDISVGNKNVDVYDLKYGLEYKPVANVAIGAGIQKSKVLAEDGTSKGDLWREGNYFEVVVKF